MSARNLIEWDLRMDFNGHPYLKMFEDHREDFCGSCEWDDMVLDPGIVWSKALQKFGPYNAEDW